MHWKQTDCWYYTLPGTKKRISLFDDQGERIRGARNSDAAEHALARVNHSGEMNSVAAGVEPEWNLARVCSEYLQYCERSVLAIVLAAFNRAEEMFDVPSPLKGLKKPQSQPRMKSFSPEDEQTLYGGTEECFRNFLFAAIHTGLRPYCELAKITADHVEQTERGMMWRGYSSKTKKTRKIPVHDDVAKLVRRLMVTAPMWPASRSSVTRRANFGSE